MPKLPPRLRRQFDTFAQWFWWRVIRLRGDGEPEIPEWVPENAKSHVNFAETNRGGWNEEDGEVTITTLVGADENTEGAWTESLYDPANLTSDGLVMTQVGRKPIALLGDLLSRVLTGATIVVRWLQPTESTSYTLAVMDAGGADAIDWLATPGVRVRGSSWNGDYFNSIEGAGVINSGSPTSANAFGLTLVPPTAEDDGRAEFVINGSEVDSYALTTSDWPVSAFVAAVIDLNGTLQSITVYDPLPSTAGLAALAPDPEA
jgi:hypothetical protein